jgi:hypothetical protein
MPSLDRVLDSVDAHPHLTLLDHALAHFQLLLIERDTLFLRIARAAGRPGICRRSVDRVKPTENAHDSIVVARRGVYDQNRIAAPEPLRNRWESSSGNPCRFMLSH